ncbi:heavy metal sensor histidine kinase [Paraburkholderia kirstenboschensis]|uniref:Sensor protein n=1 Tax=Paraburkholderia kirstenboschensis TaxID=1245436 RepID=A0ABZ0E8R5_9BURK|nr:heavy metal sensor histidine kinase [Paraburkholderia kirstenboschensis]WOD13630.1 heavy metal sensor histidine kinase [Paraburkholderia kirstenboschensis]
MARRSLTATLALAFAGTTVLVFVVVSSVLYYALDRQVKQQDDLDIVLIARHARRLAQEFGTLEELRGHSDRLTGQVLGNSALSMEVRDAQRNVLFQHNAAGIADPATPSPALTNPLGASHRITQSDIGEWHAAQGAPVRGLATYAVLRDGTLVAVIVARNMTDRWRLLDWYRDRLYAACFAGMLLAFMLSWMLLRESLRPLRVMAHSAATITVDRLDTRIEVDNAPSELITLVVSLNAMLNRLDGGFQRMSQYTADLAHDMRTPLGNLRGSTEVALSRPRSADEYQSVLASNLEECDRMSRMIENVLFLARAEHPQFVRTLTEVDAARELKRIADYFEGVADDAGVQIRVAGGGELHADVELFRRAVNNLLANAIRYTPQGGAITLSAQTPAAAADTLRVTVANEGGQIDPSLLERVFDRFYRVDPSRKNEPNSTGTTGLGLAIVRTIMELHGGSAHAESDTTSTRFILTFAKRQERRSAPGAISEEEKIARNIGTSYR